jgi:hypothetical protein
VQTFVGCGLLGIVARGWVLEWGSRLEFASARWATVVRRWAMSELRESWMAIVLLCNQARFRSLEALRLGQRSPFAVDIALRGRGSTRSLGRGCLC